MIEIESEEYVRTNNGIIAKVLCFEYEDYGDRGNIIYKVDREVFDETEGFEEENEYVLPDQIKKHSFNIIDLIETGDIVEVPKAYGEEGTILYHMIDGQYTESFTRNLKIEYIVTILTHEQYAQNCYKVKE